MLLTILKLQPDVAHDAHMWGTKNRLLLKIPEPCSNNKITNSHFAKAVSWIKYRPLRRSNGTKIIVFSHEPTDKIESNTRSFVKFAGAFCSNVLQYYTSDY